MLNSVNETALKEPLPAPWPCVVRQRRAVVAPRVRPALPCVVYVLCHNHHQNQTNCDLHSDAKRTESESDVSGDGTLLLQRCALGPFMPYDPSEVHFSGASVSDCLSSQCSCTDLPNTLNLCTQVHL